MCWEKLLKEIQESIDQPGCRGTDPVSQRAGDQLFEVHNHE
jgi:hypothetical protein